MPNLLKKPPYLERFGLKEPPYTTNPNERFMYLTGTHEEAVATIDHIIDNREGAGLIIGTPGTGKTTLMRYVYSALIDNKDYRVAAIENAARFASPFQMVKEILEAFGEECVGQNTQARYKQFESFLIISSQKNIVPILLVDEAQNMNKDQLESMRGLLNIETPENGKFLQVILFAMPEIARRLVWAKSFQSRLWKTDLEPMTEQETEEMLKWRFAQAGGKLFPFEPSALSAIFEISGGNPRTICALAQLSLEIAAVKNTTITPAIIQEVSKKRFINN